MPAEARRRTFTTSKYHQMTEAGILDENDRVELIEGEIVEMAAIGSLHAACVNRLNHLFSRYFLDRAIVSVQNPITLNQHSEPEPDIAIVRMRPDFYAEHHPTPDDVHLIVEVADASLSYDRGFKLPVYARAGVREVWIVDIAESSVEAHSQPSAYGYKLIRKCWGGDALALEAFPDVSFQVGDIVAFDECNAGRE